jgi:hypothetical protein
VLSDLLWRRVAGGDPEIAGRRIRIGGREMVVAGVAPAVTAVALPEDVDAWILTPDEALAGDGPGYVIGRALAAGTGDGWMMTAPRTDGSFADFSCTRIYRTPYQPWDIFLFALFLACVALPATTSLPLGEYRVSSVRLAWSTKVRRWAFLAAKIALLLPLVYMFSLDVAYGIPRMPPAAAGYVQLLTGLSACLLGLRWALGDQRGRCPVCLSRLTHPARVGQPSRSFLAWNGTELICVGGHGLLHVPELETSWFGEQRWLYLDPSWSVLFADAPSMSAGYF